MPEILDFFGQKWAAPRRGELTLFLNHSELRPHEVGLYLQMEFVPPWKLERDEEGGTPAGECRTLHLTLDASLPRTGDWQALFGLRIEHRDEVVSGGEIISPQVFAPEIDVWSSGHGPIHEHLKHLWETALHFGLPDTRDPYLLPFEVSAFCPSDRARRASLKLAEDEIKSWFGEHTPEDFESLELTKEGRWLHFAGHCRFDTLSCTVPVNSTDPIGYAQAMARRELKLAEFGFCRVNGGNRFLGEWKPTDGVIETGGRLVILETMSEYYRAHAAQIIASARALAAHAAAKNPPPSGDGKTGA